MPRLGTSFRTAGIGALVAAIALVATADSADAAHLRWRFPHPHPTPSSTTDSSSGNTTSSGLPNDGSNNSSTATLAGARVYVFDQPGGTQAKGVLLGGTPVIINRCVQGWCLLTKPMVGWVFETDVNK